MLASAMGNRSGHFIKPELHFRALAEGTREGVAVSVNGILQEVNDQLSRILGYERNELIGQPILRFVPSGYQARVDAEIRSGHETQFEHTMLRKDGSIVRVETHGRTVDQDGISIGLTIIRDVTERVHLISSLKESEERLRSIINQSPIAMTFVSDDGSTIDANEAACRMYGYQSVEEMIGKPAIGRISPSKRLEITNMVERRMNGGENHLVYETTAIRKDGAEFPILVSSKRMVISDNPVTSIFIIDITDRKKSEEHIRRLAYYDQLTDLPNRTCLIEMLEQRLQSRPEGEEIGALLLIDLDNFRILNETLGHDVGDLLLKEVAQRLTKCTPEGNLIARLGGDEFLIFLGNGLEGRAQGEILAQARSLGDCILKELSLPYHASVHELQGTSSIGITPIMAGKPAKSFLNEAEIAMYHAKRHGKNTQKLYDAAMQEVIVVHAEIERGIKRAIEEGQFTLFYQIQVNRLGQPVGAESLIRWTHPTRGLVAPSQFIPIAEETELISQIGKWVIDSACRQLQAWSKNELTRGLALSINVSPKQFHKPGFAAQLIERIDRHGIDPRLLKIELTETALLDNAEETVKTFTTLSDMGVQFSLDDFGTGYSSLQYLKCLPLNQLKIDQSFVRDITESASALAIVQTIISMSRSLGMEVIAEGVETEEVRGLLLESGCHYFQGYLFGRPEPVSRFEKALRRRSITASP